MAKVINKTKGFSSLPRDLVYDNDLPDRARFLYIYMACKPEGWEFYQDKMAEELGYGKDTLKKYMDILIERGWISRGDGQQHSEDGRFGAVKYTIEIIPLRKNTVTEKNRNGKIPTQRNIYNINSSNSTPINKDNNIIYNKKKYNNNIIIKKKFSKPTVDDIYDYVKEKGFHFDAEQFYDYYESKGWVVGKSPMKDWKAACRTWERLRISKDKKEEKEEMPAGMTREQWSDIQEWMGKKTPRISDRINPDMFLSMKGLAHFKSQIVSDILQDINNSDFEGDILKEFDRLTMSDEYRERVME